MGHPQEHAKFFFFSQVTPSIFCPMGLTIEGKILSLMVCKGYLLGGRFRYDGWGGGVQKRGKIADIHF